MELEVVPILNKIDYLLLNLSVLLKKSKRSLVSMRWKRRVVLQKPVSVLMTFLKTS